MKTKTEIIQSLLDEKKIIAEDAVVLLTPDGHKCTCKKKKKDIVPFPPINPFPATPYSPTIINPIPLPYTVPSYPFPPPYTITCNMTPINNDK